MNAKIEIKKGVPIPPPAKGRGSRPRYDFTRLEPGDCFEVPLDGSGRKTLRSLQGLLSSYGAKQLGKGAVTVRVFKDRQMVCVWRVK